MTRKRYKIKLKTLGPVHIGSGQTINKGQYVYIREEKKVYIINETKLMTWIIDNGLVDSFEDHFSRKNAVLYTWFEKTGNLRIVPDLSHYFLSTDSLIFNKNVRLNDITLAIKDPSQNPYIPGSSFKGLLRLAIFSDQVRAKKNYRKELDSIASRIKSARNRRDLKNLDRNTKIESQIFDKKFNHKGKNFERSIMENILISDSDPIDKKNLILAQKIDVNTEDDENPLPTFRESIRPNTEINMDMVIKENEYVDINGIEAVLENLYYDIDEAFLWKFGVEEREPLLVYLGGGVGFQSKTAVYSAYMKESQDGYTYDDGLELTSKILDVQFYKHKHKEDVKLGVSPKRIKMTRYKKQLLEMGLCKLDFEEVGRI